MGILEIENFNRRSNLKNVYFNQPDNLWKLKNLITLKVLNIKLMGIPEIICKFKSLWKLTLWNNEISSIPELLLKLKNLKFKFQKSYQITKYNRVIT